MRAKATVCVIIIGLAAAMPGSLWGQSLQMTFGWRAGMYAASVPEDKVNWSNDFIGHVSATTTYTLLTIQNHNTMRLFDPVSGEQLPGSPITTPDASNIRFVRCMDIDGDGLDEVFVSSDTEACIIEWVGPTTSLSPFAGNVGAAVDLSQNFPNPFNPTTTIQYSVPTDAPVTLTIYDVQGRRVRVLQDGRQAAGNYAVQWDGRNEAGAELASGTYYYQLVVDGQTQSKKMIVLK